MHFLVDHNTIPLKHNIIYSLHEFNKITIYLESAPRETSNHTCHSWLIHTHTTAATFSPLKIKAQRLRIHKTGTGQPVILITSHTTADTVQWTAKRYQPCMSTDGHGWTSTSADNGHVRTSSMALHIHLQLAINMRASSTVTRTQGRHANDSDWSAWSLSTAHRGWQIMTRQWHISCSKR